MRVSNASRCVERGGWGQRLVALVALVAQLAIFVHGALVEHVTCGADGALVDVHGEVGGGAVPQGADVVRATTDAGHDDHDHCLLDDDADAACPSAPLVGGAFVALARAPSSRARRALPAARRAPLYRLAPKNSPPA